MLALLIPLAASSSGGGSALAFLLPLILMGGIFYFLLIRPQQRQRRKQADLLSNLSVGDEVQTIGGMFGTITDMDDESVTLEVAPDVEIRFLRGSIARRLVYDEEEYADQGETPEKDGHEEEQEHEEEEAGGQK